MQQNLTKEYQCPGCMDGPFPSCFKSESDDMGVGCSEHTPGTAIVGIGKIFLGMPKGFNRLGPYDKTKLRIYEDLPPAHFNVFNLAVWKYLDKNGNTLVRGIRPRTNEPYVDIFRGDHRKSIDCVEVDDDFISKID